MALKLETKEMMNKLTELTEQKEHLLTIAKKISNEIQKVKKDERNKVATTIASDNNVEIEFPEDRVRMGCGGVGQVICKSQNCKIQLNAGVGNWNYANVAIIRLKKN